MEVTPGFDAVARSYLVLLLVGLPWAAVKGVPDDEEVLSLVGSRRALYLSTVVSLALLAGLTWAVGAWRGVEAGALGWRAGSGASLSLWALATTVGGLAAVWVVSRIGRAVGARESPLVRLLIPVTRADRWNFVMLSAAAGVFEEFVFRGYLLYGLWEWTGATWVAVGVTSLAFGVGHGYQRTVGIARASVLGLVLALPVVLTGSLYPAVVAHFWINVIIGLGGWRWLMETDGPAEGPRPVGDGAGDRR